MPRSKRARIISSSPHAIFYKPQGICLKSLETVQLLIDEYEALKLHDVDNLSQIQAAQAMGISQPTFARILNTGYKKISTALFAGKAIAIQQKGRHETPSTTPTFLDHSQLVCDVCAGRCMVTKK